jgi:hypothetical protein
VFATYQNFGIGCRQCRAVLQLVCHGTNCELCFRCRWLPVDSSGLFDLIFGIIINEGTGYAFEITPPEAFYLPALSKDSYLSDFQNKITTAVTAMILVLQFLSMVEENFVGKTGPREHIIDVSCETATIDDFPQGDGQGGTSYAVTFRRGF